MNNKATISKERNAKHVKLLEGLLKLPENKECADCKNKAPRWASINLGIFICLQCSGIHRSLGVHISKVRSATLDTWLPEQVAFIQNMGNEKSNAYWEAELPLHYNRSRFENFIRAKYVEKLWVPRESKLKSPPKSEECVSRESKVKSRPKFEERASPPSWSSTNQRIDISKGSLVEEQESSREERASAQSLNHRKNINIADIATNQVVEKKDFLIDGKRDADPSNHEMHKDVAEDQTKKIVPDSGLENDLQKTESVVLKDPSAAANAAPVITPPKIDYTTELFRMLWVDDSAESDSSPSSDMSTWVDFDTDEEDTIQRKVASAGKVQSEPKTKDVAISIVTETERYHQNHQKDAANHNQGRPEEPNKASAGSIHLKQLPVPAQGGTCPIDASQHAVPYHESQTSVPSIYQQHVNSSQERKSINHSPGTQLPTVSTPPAKFTAYTAPYTTSSLYKRAVPLNNKPSTPASRPPATLPVSGYDYDFSFLTQGMFTKH